MTTKQADIKNPLETKSIAELLELAASTQRILQEKQNAIREQAVEDINRIAKESGIKVWIRLPKSQDGKSSKLYRNPADSKQTYNGRGAMPKWLKELVAAGHDKSEFEVSDLSSADVLPNE